MKIRVLPHNSISNELVPAIPDISRYCNGQSISTLLADLLQETTTTKKRFDRLIKIEQALYERIPVADFSELGENRNEMVWRKMKWK